MLTLNNVAARYGSAQVLNGMSFSVEDNEVTVLLGRNGMGKTSTIRSIMRLSTPEVTDGQISMQGVDLRETAPHKVAATGLGYVPQGRRVFGSLTVEENLTTVARAGRDGSTVWTPERIYSVFPRLHDRRRQRGGTLSGGEQQMLAIGRALVTNPRLILLDEPSEGLAPNIVSLVAETIHILKQEGMGVLVAEQDIRFALGFADVVHVLENGVVVATGSPEKIDRDSALKERYLGVGGAGSTVQH